jgi:hypothetical protein
MKVNFSIFLYLLVSSLLINVNLNGQNSILSEGEIYKIEVKEAGIYKLDASFLTSSGISISNINPQQIQIFGNGGGKLPELISKDRPYDLVENNIIVQGGEDGNFGENDYILFYADGPDLWRIADDGQSCNFEKNTYSTSNFYFLRLNVENGARIENKTIDGTAEVSTNFYEKSIRHEIEKVNLLGSFASTQGSGQTWYGEIFTNQVNQNFNQSFSFPNREQGYEAKLKAVFAGRSNNSSRISITVDDQEFEKNIGSVDIDRIEFQYAKNSTFNEKVILNSDNPQVDISFEKNGNSAAEGWLDYIELTSGVENNYTGNPYLFYDTRLLEFDIIEYNIESSIPVTVWDVTGPESIADVTGNRSANITSVKISTNHNLKKLYAFNVDTDPKQPVSLNRIENQDLHSISDTEYAIVYHSNFSEAANRLAEHRRSHNPIATTLINVDKIYNEFSSGKVDPTAIRDFARHLSLTNSDFNFLLLLGDGSYDYVGNDPALEFQNYIPVYETIESLDPIDAFPTDDYYALISDNEGLPNLKGAIDLAVGRLPAGSPEEANIMVDKIIYYETSPEAHGEWRQNLGFTADDEDTNTHINQADEIANKVQDNNPIFNQEKVYFDAFVQQVTPGGARFPAATEKINNNIFKGQLILNYLGHGGPKGWAQERVLTVNDILEWDNPSKLPVIITATCSFTGYDDPGILTAGEATITRDAGGAVALFTTVRAVYSFQNKRLTEAVFDHIFTREEGKTLRIGEIMKRAKNSNSQDTTSVNSRKFALMGDPAMRLSIPEHNISIRAINGKTLSEITSDTLKALDKIKLNGVVEDYQENLLSDFNGKIYVTLFDKEKELETLANDEKSNVKKFKVRENILYKGSASVENGQFSIEFFIPKDINFNIGTGKLSLYATDQVSRDAGGYFDELIIGGSSETATADDLPPIVNLYMNDNSFVPGGITDDSPILLVELEDDFGINISGTSIGHDLLGVLDGNVNSSFILNNFYEAETDNFMKGIVRFPLNDLEPGLHTISVKAWDISNNSTEAELEFRVVEEDEEKVLNVSNYPNPFSTTTNFTFEHDLAGQNIEISIQIYTMSGKLVKTITNTSFASGYRFDSQFWDGNDDYSSNLANGIYLYKINLRSLESDATRESDFQKLIKMN